VQGPDAFGYTFDYRNRMTGFDGPGTANDAEYTFYPHHWTRHTKTVGAGTSAVTTKFLWDGDNTVAEYDAADTNTATYVTPFLDQNLALTIPAGQADAGTYYYMQDGLGSVRNLLDASQTVKNRYDYEAFGQPFAPGTAEEVYNRFTFTGRRDDPESGLMFYRNRELCPTTGRLLARDRAGFPEPRWRGGFVPTYEVFFGSVYAYVGSNPVRMVDPTGWKLLPCTEAARRPSLTGGPEWSWQLAAVGLDPGVQVGTGNTLNALCRFQRKVFIDWTCPCRCLVPDRKGTYLLPNIQHTVIIVQNSGVAFLPTNTTGNIVPSPSGVFVGLPGIGVGAGLSKSDLGEATGSCNRLLPGPGNVGTLGSVGLFTAGPPGSVVSVQRAEETVPYPHKCKE
jgi:RHS repeat-associated protein